MRTKNFSLLERIQYLFVKYEQNKRMMLSTQSSTAKDFISNATRLKMGLDKENRHISIIDTFLLFVKSFNNFK